MSIADTMLDTRNVKKPGRYIMSNNDYHSDKNYISSSQFKEALSSPAHFKYYVVDKKCTNKATKAMDKGTLLHTVIIEPYKVDDEYIIHQARGECNKDGSIKASTKTKLEDKYPGKVAVSGEWYDFAVRARRNFEEYPQAADLLFDKDNEAEVSYFHICEETKLRVRVRPDILNLKRGYIIDLKTTSTENIKEFKNQAIYQFHYDLSAFMYVLAVYQATGILCDFYFGVVGTEDMCPVWIYKASESFMSGGKDKYFKAAGNIQSAFTLDTIRAQLQIEEI